MKPNRDGWIKGLKFADLAELGNIKEKFDLIFCVATLHHIPSDKLRQQILVNIKNRLKPDGKLLMTNWNLWQSKYLKYIIKYTLLKLTDPNKVSIDGGAKRKNLDFQDFYNLSKKLSALYACFYGKKYCGTFEKNRV